MSGVETTYYATTTIQSFIKFLQNKRSSRLFTAVTSYKVFTIISHRFDKNTRNRFTQIEPKEKLIQKKGLTLFELVRRIENIDVIKKNLIRAATDLVESRLFRSQRIAFSEDKIFHFYILVLHQKPIDSSNLRSFCKRPQKLKNYPTYPSASGCAGPKNVPDLPRRPVDLFLQNMKYFYNIFRKTSCGNQKKMVVQFFIRDRGWNWSWLVKTVEIHLTPDQKVTFDN